jgi:hypothetical protein
MSVQSLELLKIVGLLDKAGNPCDLSQFDDATLEGILDYYIQKSTEGLEKAILHDRITEGRVSALRSSLSCTNSVPALLPSTFIFERVFAEDPLFECCERPNELAAADMQQLGMPVRRQLNRARIVDGLAHVSQLAPLIRDRVVSLLPISHLHRPPKDIPIFYSEDQFESNVPEHIKEFVRQSVRVHELMPLPDGSLAILNDPPSSPTRGIAIEFDDDHLVSHHPIYLLHSAWLNKAESGEIVIRQVLDWSDKPSQEQFGIWIKQSINKTVLNRLADIASEISLANSLNATYQTDSSFESQLVGLSAEMCVADPSLEKAVNFLDANAPFLNLDSPDVVAALRRDNAKLFARWQQTLFAVIAELNEDDINFEAKARRLYVKEIEPQITDLRNACAKLPFSASTGAIAGLMTVGMALLKSSGLPFSAYLGILGGGPVLGAIAGMLPAVADIRQKQRGPAFIWSRVAK